MKNNPTVIAFPNPPQASDDMSQNIVKNPITLPRNHQYILLITDGPSIATLENAKVTIDGGFAIYEGVFTFKMMPAICFPEHSDGLHLLAEPSLPKIVPFQAQILDLKRCRDGDDLHGCYLMLRVMKIASYQSDFDNTSGWKTRSPIVAGNIVYLSYHSERREGSCAFQEKNLVIGPNHRIERRWSAGDSIDYYYITPKPSFASKPNSEES